MSGSDDYALPGDSQGGPGGNSAQPPTGARVLGTLPDEVLAGVLAAIPAGCAALWHANGSTVDPGDIEARAVEAARRTHRDQAVLLPDGTVKVIPGGVPGTTSKTDA